MEERIFKPIRLVVSDVDSTIQDSKTGIPGELPDVIAACKAKKITFALATGRTLELAQKVIARLGIEAPCVLGNGAYIYQGAVCLKSHGFSLAPLREILKEACEAGLTVTISDLTRERPVTVTPYVEQKRKEKGQLLELFDWEGCDWEHQKFQKVMIFDVAKSGKISTFRKKLEAFRRDYWITNYDLQAVEIGPKDCNKATGTAELAGMLGIPMEQVMAIGDFENDVEMITQAGLGVAVANASEKAKRAADYVTENPCGKGVIEALQLFCLKRV